MPAAAAAAVLTLPLSLSPSLSLFPAVPCYAVPGLVGVSPQDNQPAAAPMSDGERGELLRHLKVKWASVNVEYQKLGFVMDIGEQPLLRLVFGVGAVGVDQAANRYAVHA